MFSHKMRLLLTVYSILLPSFTLGITDAASSLGWPIGQMARDMSGNDTQQEALIAQTLENCAKVFQESIKEISKSTFVSPLEREKA